MKKLLVSTLSALSLSGCVGAWVETPTKTTTKTAAYDQMSSYARTPVITRTQKVSSTREWCGTTLWVVIIPIPLKLPVCESYSEYAYGNDIHNVEKPMLFSSQTLSSPFYACGPFMFMAPLMHSYQGNGLCGVFP